MNEKLNRYILEGWKKTVRVIDREEAEHSSDGKLYLPYPYTVPCVENTFQAMYYWDTYFANQGLLLSGKNKIVANNLQNFIYMIDTYGHIPNGSKKKYLNRSQPPFFGMMLHDYYETTGDCALFENGMRALKKELAFWNSCRKAPNGLNHYSCDAEASVYLEAIALYEARTGIYREGDREYLGKNAYAEAESGWDFNGRFEGRCYEYNPVDLNALLYFDEQLLAQYSPDSDRETFACRASLRKQKMLTLMRAEDGVFYDYCYTTGKRTSLRSCASFFPLFVGLVRDSDGVDRLLSSLELPYGLQATEACDGNYQWGTDNGWACLQLIACKGLLACGRLADSKRIARKYIALVERCYEQTGHLWEKYNVRNGNHEAVDEYGTPQMLGWSAGVYQALCAIFETL